MLTVDFDRLGVGPGTRFADVGAGGGGPTPMKESAASARIATANT